MSERKTEMILDRFCIATTPVDALSAVVPLGTVTHLIFTMREPDTDGRINWIVQARLAVPTEQIQTIGRTLLSGRLDLQATVDDDGETTALH
jgi:hypothetical protein